MTHPSFGMSLTITFEYVTDFQVEKCVYIYICVCARAQALYKMYIMLSFHDGAPILNS